MSFIPEASTVNCQFHPSTRLKHTATFVFSLVSLLLFLQTTLPLEAKTLLMVALLNELQRVYSLLSKLVGAFSLDIEGNCQYQAHLGKLTQALFVSPLLIIFDVKYEGEQQRFFICPDSLEIEQNYRHLCRVLRHQHHVR